MAIGAGITEGIFGLVGVLVGAAVTWGQAERERRLRRKHDADYLAIRVVCTLDKYVADCARVAGDSGTPNEQGHTIARVSAPSPPEYPDDVDWRCIPAALMFEILSLPRDAQFAAEYLSVYAEDCWEPDGSDYFAERALKYAGLGIYAASIADKMRKTFKMPALVHKNWDPVQYMKDEVKREQDRRAERSKMADTLI